ncbi:uncharacterized protein LOC144664370 isoform X1 [Oculina patagonica]
MIHVETAGKKPYLFHDLRLNSRTEMAGFCLTLVLVVLPQILTLIQACDPFFGDGFDPNHESTRSRILKGKRLFVDGSNPTFSASAVFTSLECLDICLRSEHCVSFDFLGFNENICRIHRVVQHTMPLIVEKDWTHFNMSSDYLRQILSSAVDECEGRETGEAASMTQTQAKLNDYCANVAPSVDSCSKKKKQGNCAGAWIARVHDSGWCCIDSSHPSKNCCCPIPQ